MSKVIKTSPIQELPITSAFFEYRQNNSGGDFVINDDVTVYVVVEAISQEAADERAEGIGIYFHGCATGRDCSCCGDRWNSGWDDEPNYKTLEQAEVAFEVKGDASGRSRKDYWAAVGEPYAHIYLLNGQKISFIKDA